MKLKDFYAKDTRGKQLTVNVECKFIFNLKVIELRIEGSTCQHFAIVIDGGHEREKVGGDRAIVTGALAHMLELCLLLAPAYLGRWS